MDEFGKTPVPPRAEIVIIGALGIVPGLAGSAAAAGEEGKGDYPVARRPGRTLGRLAHQARELVSHDEGIVIGLAVEGARQVRAADARVPDLYEELVPGSGLGIGPDLMDQDPVLLEYQGFHDKLPPSFNVPKSDIRRYLSIKRDRS
jgi:hypothetical protein